MHSKYFRQFMDSPDKSGAPASAAFQYEYVTVLDHLSGEGRGWSLQSSEKTTPSTTNDSMAYLHPEGDIMAIDQILRAMYRLEYKIETYDQLDRLTTTAEYYCALPVVSATLTDALLHSPMFGPSRSGHGLEEEREPEFLIMLFEILLLAKKLRHATLFREALTLVVGSWSKVHTYDRYDVSIGLGDHYQDDDFSSSGRAMVMLDKQLGPLVLSHYRKLGDHVLKIHHQVLYKIFQHGWKASNNGIIEISAYWQDSAVFYYDLDSELETASGVIPMPFPDRQYLQVEIKSLKSNLVFDYTHSLPGKSGWYREMYLNTLLYDEELPWDRTETDW
ncbi:hypothetical protein GLAREA_09480 [Glarea lozoyensis ATCC 20868]|uniref:Uncharacterized protein n=1 Tax=Glarea lozoyensis (strain ATCC 20868 / MF5171) TaxID=1116229 RepID=S3CRS2_GLAL2|nr:uncharacterized protein GLAREA_09480 [Glarea lozoyensis ATCC 20868]EPE28360.1 hypothetical protein GLAREA_09480 [Glarea lozoyensis ATCC 20868]